MVFDWVVGVLVMVVGGKEAVCGCGRAGTLQG